MEHRFGSPLLFNTINTCRHLRYFTPYSCVVIEIGSFTTFTKLPGFHTERGNEDIIILSVAHNSDFLMPTTPAFFHHR